MFSYASELANGKKYNSSESKKFVAETLKNFMNRLISIYPKKLGPNKNPPLRDKSYLLRKLLKGTSFASVIHIDLSINLNVYKKALSPTKPKRQNPSEGSISIPSGHDGKSR